MFKGKISILGATALLACVLATRAFAADKACVVFKTTGEVEQEVVNAKGEKSTKLVPVDKVVPGTQVIWTITANNVCKQPVEKVVIDDPVPAHMVYVANTASTAGADVQFSVDGKTYAAPADLTVSDNGAARKARADEYRHVRWILKSAIAPGASVSGSFRAVLE